jgi:hypothetical protein
MSKGGGAGLLGMEVVPRLGVGKTRPIRPAPQKLDFRLKNADMDLKIQDPCRAEWVTGFIF